MLDSTDRANHTILSNIYYPLSLQREKGAFQYEISSMIQLSLRVSPPIHLRSIPIKMSAGLIGKCQYSITEETLLGFLSHFCRQPTLFESLFVDTSK